MPPTERPYAADDAWRVRALLREAYRLAGRRQRAWHVARFDHARAHTVPNVAELRLEDVATLWETDGALGGPVETAPVAPGYMVRALGDGLELLERCYPSGLAFHDGDVGVAVANRGDPTWYRRIQDAPLYRRDLDAVAIAPDGAIAAFCTLWFDDPTRSVCIEPLATVPDHRRLGLARAVLTEGLRRAQRLGADLALVGGYDDGANALYGAVVGGSCERYEAWARRW